MLTRIGLQNFDAGNAYYLMPGFKSNQGLRIDCNLLTVPWREHVPLLSLVGFNNMERRRCR